MAVTYAWRLDANKYAYILGPNNEVGYVSASPIVGDALNTIAATANERFGENAVDGFTKYKEAFKKMVDKFPTEWKNYDFLSADVYYNVDSSNCADLKGVGVKGVRFLGTADPDNFDIDNPTWNTNGKVDDPGVLLVYGVYMEDQTTDDAIDKTKAPENIFVVKNGTNGTNADGSASTADLERKLNAEIDRSVGADNEMSGYIAEIQQIISTLTNISGGNLVELFNTISTLQTEVNNLKSENVELRNEIAALKEWVNSQSEGGSGSTGGSSGGVGFGGEDVTDDSTYYMIVTDVYNKLYRVPTVKYEEAVLKSENGFYQE